MAERLDDTEDRRPGDDHQDDERLDRPPEEVDPLELHPGAKRSRHSVYRADEAGGRRLPLYTEGGDPARLVLSVRP